MNQKWRRTPLPRPTPRRSRGAGPCASAVGRGCGGRAHGSARCFQWVEDSVLRAASELSRHGTCMSVRGASANAVCLRGGQMPGGPRGGCHEAARARRSVELDHDMYDIRRGQRQDWRARVCFPPASQISRCQSSGCRRRALDAERCGARGWSRPRRALGALEHAAAVPRHSRSRCAR